MFTDGQDCAEEIKNAEIYYPLVNREELNLDITFHFDCKDPSLIS